MAAVGYDLHISRATFWPDSTHYPILERELADLIQREPDLWFEPDRKGEPPAHLHSSPGYRIAGLPTTPSLRWFAWADAVAPAELGEGEWLQVSNGQIQRKYPSDEMTRRMAEIARSLDAWLTGDNDELYLLSPDGQIVTRERTADERHPASGVHHHRYLARAGRYLWSSEHPIQADEWLRFAAGQPDFRIDEHVEALLPSGWKTIARPPVAHWVGHPSGRPVPFFHDDDGYLEVHHADPATVSRMVELAPLLNATVRED
jgi:hypothetical protein